MCEHLNINGSHVIICGARPKVKFCACGRECVALCDWKVGDRKSGTCDRPICELHRSHVAANKDLCPEHQKAFEDWKLRHPPAQKSLFQEGA